MHYRWQIASPTPLEASALSRELGISPLVAQCLIQRGFSDAAACARFLQPRLKDLADPFLLPNMRQAVDRLFLAREQGESLVIFGDYDVDGVTSSALLLEVLGALGWQVSCYLPHRMDEGYGLSREGVSNCLAQFKTSLLLAVDCGSTAVETIQWLAESAIEVIVLDHHQVSDPPPAAAALVNPQLARPDEPRFTELCSVGLAFKLAHGLVKEGRARGVNSAQSYDLRPLLDLVALGTIADLVPLTGENRILVSAGLERLKETARPGLQALKEVAQTPDQPGVYEVAFQLAPRLNAAGRLENALSALQLIMARTSTEAMPLARALDSRNRERQNIERSICETVIGAVRARFDPAQDYVIVEGQLLWHIGVVGIVASRVVREFHRPALIIGGEGTEWRGSGRSIEGFDLAAALRQCSDLLLRHGGHPMAAGLSIDPANLEALRTRLNQLARATLQPEQLQPRLRLDAEASLADLTAVRIREIHRLNPFGQGNPPVQLVVRSLRHARPPQCLGKEKQHLKMWVTDGRETVEAVWWNCVKEQRPERVFDLAAVPQINCFQGEETVQLRVLDWRLADRPEPL